MRTLAFGTVAVTLMVFAAPAKAQDAEARKLTNLTFSSAVQLPGFELAPGKYQFSLADPEETRRVVQVADDSGKKVIGMFLTIPDQRLKLSDKPVVMFSETPAGTPPAIRAWFYPGESIGYELVYPKDQAIRIAKMTHQRVLASDSDERSPSGDRVKALHGAHVGHVDENGTFTPDSDTAATSGVKDSKARKQERDR